MTYWAFILFFVFEYVRPGAYFPPLDALQGVMPLCAIAGTALLKSPVSNAEFFKDKNTKILGVLLFLLVVSTLLATVTERSYDITKNVFAYILIAHWVQIRQVGDLRRLKGVFVILIVVHLIVAALNPALFTDPDNRVGINSGAFLGDGNDFSLSIIICIPLCLFLLLETKRKIAKVGWGIATLALVMAVVATKSRGGTVALGAVMLYFWFNSQKKALMAGVFALMVLVVLAIAPPAYFARMGMIADTQEDSAQGRIQAWRTAVQMAVKSPLLGVGAGHFPLAYGAANESRWMTAHSIYFLLLGELGLPGIAVLLTFLYTNFAANTRLRRKIRDLPPAQAATSANILLCTSAALLAFATAGAFLSAAYYPHWYVLSGMLVASRHVVRQQIEAHEHDGATSMAGLARVAERKPVRPDAISPDWVPRPVGTNFYAAHRTDQRG